MGLDPAQQGRGRRLLGELRREPYIEYRRSVGYRIKNDPDAQARAAVRLRSTCGYRPIQIEATLSRFEQAGGFESYDASSIRESQDPW